MQSCLVYDNLRNYYQQLSLSDKTKLLTFGNKFKTAYGSMELKDANLIYPEFLSYVQTKEQETGIQILQSPDSSYYAALIELSNRLCNAVEAVYKGEEKVISFNSIMEADFWLMNQHNISVRYFQLETGSSLGLFANHTSVKRVTIHYILYKYTVKYCYRITESEDLHMLIRHKVKDMSKEWNEKNPGTEYVYGQSFRNARGNSSSLLLGFGNYMEHIKKVILYRKPVEYSAAPESEAVVFSA